MCVWVCFIVSYCCIFDTKEEICSSNFIYTSEFEMTFDTQSKWEWLCRQKFDSVWRGEQCARMEWFESIWESCTQTQLQKWWRGNLIERRLQVRNCLTSAKYDCTWKSQVDWDSRSTNSWLYYSALHACVWAIFFLNWLRHRKREESNEKNVWHTNTRTQFQLDPKHTHTHNMANFIYLEIAFDFHAHERKRIPVIDDTR